MQPYCCKQKSKAFPHLEAGEALLQLRQKSVDLFPMIVNSWDGRTGSEIKLFYAVLEHIPDPGEIRTEGVLIGGVNLNIVGNLNMEVVTIEAILLAISEEHELVLDEEPSMVKLDLGMEQVKLLLPATIEDRFADKLVCIGGKVADLLGGEGSHDELSFY